MKTELKDRRYLMLPCPHCETNIELSHAQEWVLCPKCGKPVLNHTKKETNCVKPMSLSELYAERKKEEDKLKIIKDKINNKQGQDKRGKERKNENVESLHIDSILLKSEEDAIKKNIDELDTWIKSFENEKEDAIKKSDPSNNVLGCSFLVILIDLLILFWVVSINRVWITIVVSALIVILSSILLSSAAKPILKKDEKKK